MPTPFQRAGATVVISALIVALHPAPARAQALAPRGLYRGLVLEARGRRAVANAMLTFTDKNSGVGISGFTDDEGRYEIRVPRGTYSVLMMVGDKTYEPEEAVRPGSEPRWSLTFAPSGEASLSEQQFELLSDKQDVAVTRTSDKKTRGARMAVTLEVINPPPADVTIREVRIAPERDLRPGDPVDVVVQGTPHGSVTVSLGAGSNGQPLAEDSQAPGTYRGRVAAPAKEGAYPVSATLSTEEAGEATLNGPQIEVAAVAPTPPVIVQISEQPQEVAPHAAGNPALPPERPASATATASAPAAVATKAAPVLPPALVPSEAIDPAALTRELAKSRAYFDFDRATIRDDAGAALTTAVGLLQGRRVLLQPELWLFVEGHCDEVGSDQYNDLLGMRRAEAARNVLVAEGLPSERIRAVSYGRHCPVSRVGRMADENRRVQLRVVSAGGAGEPRPIDAATCPGEVN